MNAQFTPGIRLDLLNPRLRVVEGGSVGGVATRKKAKIVSASTKAQEAVAGSPDAVAALERFADQVLGCAGASKEGRAVLRSGGAAKIADLGEVAHGAEALAYAALRLDAATAESCYCGGPPNMASRAYEVLLVIHASIVDNDAEQFEELAEVARRKLRTGSATAQEHGRASGVAMSRLADWGVALVDQIRQHKESNTRPDVAAALLGIFLALHVPRFRGNNVIRTIEKLFKERPDVYAIEDPTKIAIECCCALGMTAKDAYNAVVTAPKMRDKGRGRFTRLKTKQV
jgi:hypothetical protein